MGNKLKICIKGLPLAPPLPLLREGKGEGLMDLNSGLLFKNKNPPHYTDRARQLRKRSHILMVI